jgi:peptidoglycan biosynthesis protein MviN/MurJ (putative lipid II flippase)
MKFHFLKIESYRKGIVLSSALNFVSKLLIFFQGVAVAYYFGTHAKTDIYFYCYSTILMVGTFVNSLDASVLIPESMRLREQQGTDESMRFLNSFIYLYLIFGIAASLLFLLAPVDIMSRISNFSGATLEQSREVVLLSVPVFTLLIMTNLLVNVLTSYKFFTIPMIITSINGIMALLFLFVFHNALNISSVLIGQIVGYAISLVMLVYLIKKQLRWNFFLWGRRIAKPVFRNMVFAQSGNLATMLSAYAPLYLLSGFPAGVISALNYGQRTAEMPNQLITNQVSSVAGIKYNELYARKDFQYLNDVFLSTSKLLIFVLTPLSFLIFNYSEQVVTILYERGAFHGDSVHATSEFLKLFALLLPLLAIVTNASRLYMAGQVLKYSFYYQIISNVTLIVLIYFGIRQFGILGFPLALLAINVLNVLVVELYVRKLFPFIRYKYVLIYLVKNIVLNVVLLFLVNLLLEQVELNPVLSFLVGSMIYVLLLLTFNFFTAFNDDINQIVLKCKSYVFR